MEEEEVCRRVKKVVATHLDVDRDRVTMEANFIGDLGADELDMVELVIALEEEFGIEIPGDDAKEITTVGKTVQLIAPWI
jgi:acyl carrier protein